MRRDRAQIARDIAVARLAKVNRWVTAAAFVAVGALTDVAAHAAPGHAIAKPAAASAAPSTRGRAPASRVRHRRRHVAPVHHHHVDRPLRSTKPPAAATPQPTQAAPAPAPTPAPAPAPAPSSAPVSGGS
jgi:hypothetical protein